MIAFILKNWKFCVGGLVGALIMFGAMEARIWFLNASYALKIENTRKAVIKQCEADKQLTKEVSHAYQDQIADLNNRLAGLKRVRYTCVPVTDTAVRRDAETGPRHADGNGIAAGALYDYAGKAEQYRRQLIACQSFIKKTWDAKRSTD